MRNQETVVGLSKESVSENARKGAYKPRGNSDGPHREMTPGPRGNVRGYKFHDARVGSKTILHKHGTIHYSAAGTGCAVSILTKGFVTGPILR